jgi:tubulin-specific chaperone A
MARTISDEQIKLNIIINGNPAQKQLYDLEKDTRKLTKSLEDQKIQKQQLEKQGKKDTQEYKDLTAEMKLNTNAIDDNKATMKELQNQIGLTGLTIGQLNQKAMILRMTLKNLVPGSEDYKKYDAELTQVKNRIAEVTGKAQQSKTSIGSIADSFNRYQGLAVSTVAAFTGVAYSISKIIDINGKLSDSQADVMKTTGMTKAEVDDLTKSFSALETRTSRLDLLKIAEQGGRLGVPKAEIADFVKSMNVAAVALGDSFTGGVDEVAEKLGKIKFLFKETKDMNIEQAYNSIGSAINDLGANGTANEANIAEFTKRIGSLTDVLKPTVQETLALGTAFEESGIEAETSSRAYNIFMKQASTESGKFAQVMGISKKAVEDMINTNPMNFMLDFAKGMNGMNATEVAKTLDFLGVNADGANKVIGAMGNNFERFHELIDLSNNSFANGTSLISEYNVKNENLAATLEKISKKISGWFSSETFVKWLTSAVNSFASFIGATEEAETKVGGFRLILGFTAKLLGILIGSMISYSAVSTILSLSTRNAAMSMAWLNIQIQYEAMRNSLSIVILNIKIATMNLFGASTDKATASLARLNLVTKLSPWGAVIALITAVTIAYFAFRDSVNKTATAQETFAKQQKDLAQSVSESTAQTKANMSSLIGVIKAKNVSLESQKKAYDELIKISPEFNGFLKDEKFNIEGLLAVYDQYLKSLDAVTYARQFSKLNESNIKKQIDAESKLFQAERNMLEAKKVFDDPKNKPKNIGASKRLDIIESMQESELAAKQAKANYENTIKIVDETNKFREDKINKLENIIAKEEKSILDIVNKSSTKYKVASIKLAGDKKQLQALLGVVESASPDKSSYKVPGSKDDAKTKSEKKNPNSSEDDLRKLRNEDNLKYAAEVLKNERQIEDARIAMMEDGVAKEMAIENQRYERKIEDLQKQKVHDTQMIELQAETDKAYQAGDIKKYDQLILIKKGWVQRNNNLDGQIRIIEEQERGIHNRKLHELELKSFDQSVKNLNEGYDHDKMLRETAYNNQLAALGDNEAAKESLKKEYDKKEIEANRKHLQDVVALLNYELYSQSALGLLSAEEKKAIQAKIDYYLNAMSKLKSAQSGEGKELDLGIKSGGDILGFSDDQWQKFFKNIENGTIGIQTMQMAMRAGANLYGEMDKLFSAQENADVKRSENTANQKKTHLKKQLDAGYINQKQYNKRIERVDKELDEKKFEAELAQAKRQRVISLANIAIKTAESVMSIASTGGGTYFADFGISAGILTALTLGMGMVQAAAVLATPLPVKGYEDGLYPEYVTREQDGKRFKPTGTSSMKSGLYNKPRILVGEGPGDMPEMIIDKQAYAGLSKPTKLALLRELRIGGISGYENGYYPQANRYNPTVANAPASKTINNNSNNDQLLQQLMMMINENTILMREIRETGISATIENSDYRSMKNLRTGIKNYEELNKSKKI